MAHVKSSTTDVSVARTRSEIMTVLERYGGTGFGYEVKGDDILVTFLVPGSDSNPLRVQYPVNVARVYERLIPVLKKRKHAPNREQAERVAWRNVLVLIDAAFAAAAIGATTIEEAFHAHLVIETATGQRGRMFDYVRTLRQVNGALPDHAGLLNGGKV